MKRMRKWISVCLLLVGVGASPAAEVDKALLSSVFVMDGDGGMGSAVLFKNGERTFAWTDAHVVEDARIIRTVMDPLTGQPTLLIEYKDVILGYEYFEDGRKVGEETVLAKIVRFDDEHDLAVLYIYKKNWGRASVKFATSFPKPGDAIWHVGSMRGNPGKSSVSEGVVAAAGRLRREFRYSPLNRPLVYDQVAAVGDVGSSGGGVFSKKTDECLGLVTEFLAYQPPHPSAGQFCMTPARRIREYAIAHNIEYALNDTVKVPALVDIVVRGKGITTSPISIPKDWPSKPQPAAPGMSGPLIRFLLNTIAR